MGLLLERNVIEPRDLEPERSDYPDDVQIVRLGPREVVLVGTAHVSRESADLVREVIRRERPANRYWST